MQRLPFNRFYLIDGSSYLFRAFFALPRLSTSRGLPTNAVYGFISMLLKLLREHRPQAMAVVFDGPKPSFRKELYNDYKAQRPPAPDDLKVQIPYVKEVLSAMRIPVLEVEGFEADDVIATLTEKAKREGLEVVIVSGDKDLLQLVSDQVTELDTMKDERFGPQEVREKFGVPPERIPDLIGLMGDQSDNIPGIEGIGPKTARMLIERYGTLEELLGKLDQIPDSELKPSLKEKLRKGAHKALLSKRLAQIRRDIPLEVRWEEFLLAPWDEERLRKVFQELEFKKFLRELLPSKPIEGKNYGLLSNEKELEEVLGKVKGRPFSLCLYPSSDDPILQEPIGISLYEPQLGAYYLPLGPPQGLEARGILEKIAEVLDSGPLYCHDAKPQWRLLLKENLSLRGLRVDTALMAYLLDPEGRDYSLPTLAGQYLSVSFGAVRDLVTSRGMRKVELHQARDFACEEAQVVHMLSEKLLERLREEGLEELYFEVELPLIEVLAQMELWGVKVDAGRLEGLSRELSSRLKELEAKICELSGERFNINSPQQVGRILFEKLKLPVVKRTPKKAYSTDTEVLETLAFLHEVPRLILEHRILSKLKSTYVDVLPKLIHPETGRVHTSFNQMATATGRLSSSEPNLQNIPIKGELGRRIREAFVSEPGWVLLGADYSQIELRILAHLSQDEALIEAFRSGRDIHSETASAVFGVPQDRVTPEMRRQAKVINFGIVYGMTPYGLAKELGVEPKVADRYIQDYFRRHQGVKAYIDRTLDEVRRTGVARTMFGRKRPIPGINSPNRNQRQFAERTAINTPIQGTAADLIKKAMIGIYKEIRDKGLPAKLILQVHDELLLEVREDVVESLAPRVRELMEGVAHLSVPLEVNVAWGRSWGEIH